MSIVYLIGAGPGDPGLLTVRGLQCLESADVVLYDHLVPPRLLRSARPDAEKIDVGVAAPQPLEQEAICYLLAEKAREGRTVARLKWGDPVCLSPAAAAKPCSCTSRASASKSCRACRPESRCRDMRASRSPMPAAATR
jgi:siroheme synthase